MLGSEAITLLKGRLARFTGGQSTLDTYLPLEFKAAQRRLEMKACLPSFLISEKEETTTVAGEGRVVVPTDFLREHDDDALWIVNDAGNEVPLIKKELDSLPQSFYNSEAMPRYYALVGDYFRLLPAPDKVYTVRMLYYKRDADWAEGEENNWLKHWPDYLIAETGRVIAGNYLRNKEAQQFFINEVRERYQDLIVFEQARKDANQEYYSED